jgi:hypothetical protein
LTDETLRELLGRGYRTTDAIFAEKMVENMSRTVYLMALFLVEHKLLSSIDLQRLIDDYLMRRGVLPTQGVFNPIDWFSMHWTMAENGQPNQFFQPDYKELFSRLDGRPYTYAIRPGLHNKVARILSELSENDEQTMENQGEGDTSRPQTTQETIPAIIDKNLFARHLYKEWVSDPSRTLAWWSVRWGVPRKLVEEWVRGTRRIARQYEVVFSDLPFTQKEYYASAWADALLGPSVELPLDFIGDRRRASQRPLTPALIPHQKSVNASIAFQMFTRRLVASAEPENPQPVPETPPVVIQHTLQSTPLFTALGFPRSGRRSWSKGT